jgi:hypothetical protein
MLSAIKHPRLETKATAEIRAIRFAEYVCDRKLMARNAA